MTILKVCFYRLICIERCKNLVSMSHDSVAIRYKKEDSATNEDAPCAFNLASNAEDNEAHILF